jgi:hypothetical protein
MKSIYDHSTCNSIDRESEDSCIRPVRNCEDRHQGSMKMDELATLVWSWPTCICCSREQSCPVERFDGRWFGGRRP